MKFFVTGGAGFIGSHFCDEALKRGHEVAIFDNFSTGREDFIDAALRNSKCKVFKGDIRNASEPLKACQEFKPDWVVHLAANADVRKGFERPLRDLEYNSMGTSNVLEAARLSGCKQILFSSTGSVYGEHHQVPTPEKAEFPEQTSLYGASKLYGEALISAYCHGYNFTGLVFRFVSILGPRYTHGHVFDFVKKLKANPQRIEVLGDGKQTKSYLHVDDLMRGLWLAIDSAKPGFEVYNIGHDQTLTVDQSLSYITKRMSLNPRFDYSGGVRGWIGDSPLILLDTSKLKKLGWQASHSLERGVLDTVDYLLAKPELLEHS